MFVWFYSNLCYSKVNQCSQNEKCLCIESHAATSPIHELISKCVIKKYSKDENSLENAGTLP